MDILKYNREAWNRRVTANNPWTVPVSTEVIEKAKQGDWQIVLTPTLPVPREWFPEIVGCKVLCLASGGGQQGPILAAAGAEVTVFDNSPKQLDQDRMVAKRDTLELRTVQGDMADLGIFATDSFDLIFHPVSNSYVPDVNPVWKEAYRVLRDGGALLAGFTNPIRYAFDWELAERTGELRVKYKLPYADIEDLDEQKKADCIAQGEPLEFSHSLDDQIGGQLAAGFLLTGFYEDAFGEESSDPVSKYMPDFIATRAIKITSISPLAH